jgi:hypothetical protein
LPLAKLPESERGSDSAIKKIPILPTEDKDQKIKT